MLELIWIMSAVAFLFAAHGWAGALLMALAGASLGRLMGALIRHMAHAAGYPSSHYYSLEAGGRWVDRLPVVGHFLRPLGTRSRRALVLELLAALAFAACWVLFPPAKACCGALFVLALIGASFIDLDHMIIPDLFTVGLALAGLALSAFVPALHSIGAHSAFGCARSFAAAVLGLGIGSALALWIAVIGEWILDKEVLGFGDVKFLGAIGAFCGWQGAVFSLFGGAFVGAVALVAAEVHRRLCGDSAVQLFRVESSPGEGGRLGLGAHFPFGPMLAVAAAAYFLALHPIVDRFLSCYTVFF
jgi:leader peptidase (prepilin peptidase)/N-methyltransferase